MGGETLLEVSSVRYPETQVLADTVYWLYDNSLGVREGNEDVEAKANSNPWKIALNAITDED